MTIPIEHSICLSFNRHINLNDVMNYISENGLEMIRFQLDNDFSATVEVYTKYSQGHGTWKDVDEDIENFEMFIMDLEDKFHGVENSPRDITETVNDAVSILKGRLV